jgi:hypothetical protein
MGFTAVRRPCTLAMRRRGVRASFCVGRESPWKHTGALPQGLVRACGGLDLRLLRLPPLPMVHHKRHRRQNGSGPHGDTTTHNTEPALPPAQEGEKRARWAGREGVFGWVSRACDTPGPGALSAPQPGTNVLLGTSSTPGSHAMQRASASPTPLGRRGLDVVST